MDTVNAEKEQRLSLLINTRYSRITIHRHTLRALGEPAFVYWGYNFQTNSLILFGLGTDAQKALRVSLNKDGSCYMYSKSLITGLRSVGKYLIEDGSFYLKGEQERNMPVIAFPLEQAQKVMEYDGLENNRK